MYKIGRDFRHRPQNKIPQRNLRMRDHQLWIVQNQTVIEQNIQIQRSGPPMDFSFPAGFLFGFLCTASLLPATFDLFVRQFGYFFLTSTLASYAYNQTHSIIPMTLAYSLVLLGNILLILL